MPELVRARDREVVVVCRSGYRSVLAAQSLRLQELLFGKQPKTGLALQTFDDKSGIPLGSQLFLELLQIQVRDTFRIRQEGPTATAPGVVTHDRHGAV